MIGIFDSGVGGLTVAKKVIKSFPDQKIIYFGDTARVPYGNKSTATVCQYSEEIVRFLESKGAKTIVIACNTASALAGEYLRKKFTHLQIVDVIEPAVKSAVASVSGKKAALRKIGVLGTAATIRSNVYEEKIKALDGTIEVTSVACPLFVPLVEEDWIKKPETRRIAKSYLRPLKLKRIRCVILGCTHYPLLAPVIQSVMGKNAFLVHSSRAVIETLKKVITPSFESDTVSSARRNEFYFSDKTPSTESMISKIMGKAGIVAEIISVA